MAVAPAMVRWNTRIERLAPTAPMPTNRLWVRKPRASWFFGSRSEMKAR